MEHNKITVKIIISEPYPNYEEIYGYVMAEFQDEYGAYYLVKSNLNEMCYLVISRIKGESVREINEKKIIGVNIFSINAEKVKGNDQNLKLLLQNSSFYFGSLHLVNNK